MKCDHCGNEATVHDFKLVKGGIVSQVHLCEKCAGQLGMAGKTFKSVDELLHEAVAAHVGASAEGSACTNCGLTWGEFREHGLLGCAVCYETFESRLESLLERAHEGGAQHVGKVPFDSPDEAHKTAQIRHLKQQLRDAVAAEQYERAAQLRDQLTTIGCPVASAATPEPETKGEAP